MSESTVEYTCHVCGFRFVRPLEQTVMCAVKHQPGDCCHYGEERLPSSCSSEET